MSDTKLLRVMVAMPAALIVASFIFVAVYTYTQHDPTPHRLRVAFVGPPSAEKQVQAQLAEKAPGAFELRSYASEALARKAVLDRSVYGAYLFPGSVITASAAGQGVAQAIDLVFGGAAQAMLSRLCSGASAGACQYGMKNEDIRALPANDSHGLSSSGMQAGLLLPSFVFGILLFVFGGVLPLTRRLVAISLFAIGAGFVAALTVGPIVGALAGHFWALFGIGAAFAAATALATYGLESILGFAGTGLAALLLILLGNSTAGGAMNQEFLPGGFRQIGQALPGGAAVRAVRNTVYFGGHHIGQALAVISLWALAGLALVLAAERLRGRKT